MRANGVDERTLDTLITAGAVRGVRVSAQGQRWTVEIQSGQAGEWLPLVAARGHVRQWRSLDTVAGWLRSRGIGEWATDARAYSPTQEGLV